MRRWDEYTVANEPVTSIDLMERAAQRCVDWIASNDWFEKAIYIFCGKGNNGGDGLAIARLLLAKGYYASTYILEWGKTGTPEFQQNLQRLHAVTDEIHFLQNTQAFPYLPQSSIVVDALFGSGLNKPLEGLSAALVNHINQSGAAIVSIDLPSGLFADHSSLSETIIKATHTLTFQTLKRALLLQEAAPFMGDVKVLDIGLHPAFEALEQSPFEFVEAAFIKQLFKPRSRFAHKGNYGHALLAAGSWGKMGAAVLAAKACLRSGVGLLTCYIPACGYGIMQSTVPEAMALTDDHVKCLSVLPNNIEKYNAIGVGPGIGTDASTQLFLSELIAATHQPMVLDADALNCLALQKKGLTSLPSHSILTPHPKEFDRLFGDHRLDDDRIQTAIHKASELQLIILLKGHHTAIVLPDGRCYFNSTGNAGMAKGGSGDVLTGILTALLAQGYPPFDAALLGVYLHGLAGDKAAQTLSMESLLPTDLVLFLSESFHFLY